MKIYKNYVLAVLTAMLILSGVERSSLGLMLQDIKAAFALTDTQLGLLSGVAFALFYSVLGVPIARWADRGNRVTIISLAALIFSAGTALCGVAGSFAQLLLARVGVAASEAGCMPPSFSLIADYFDRAERPRAVALYGGVASAATAMLGFSGAGWLIELYGWRKTFFLVAIPGLVLAAILRLTVREPRVARAKSSRADAPKFHGAPVAHPSMREVGVALWNNRSFRHLLMCMSVMTFFSVGIGQWMATYFIRSFALTTGQIGTGFAVVFGIGALLGAFLGGELSSRYAAQNERLQLRGVALTIAFAGICATCVYLSPEKYWAFGFSGLMMVGLTAINGPMFATMQALVSDNMRAVAFALAYLVSNLIGMSLGPLAVGALSDGLRPWVGAESVRYALLILAPGYVWAGWHVWRASLTVTADVAATSGGLPVQPQVVP